MGEDDLRKLLGEQLRGGMATASGSVLYSGVDTLKPGDFYVLGANPGGAPSPSDPPVAEVNAHTGPWSAYTCDCWQSKCAGPSGECEHIEAGRVKPQFLVKHQRNVAALFSALGRSPEAIFCSNFIFARSKSTKALQKESGCFLKFWAEACWPVHQALLNEVRPRWIISLGYGADSAYGLLKKHAGDDWKESPVIEERKDAWTYKGCFDLGPGRRPLSADVLGIPHPSYHALDRSLAQFIRSKIVVGV